MSWKNRVFGVILFACVTVEAAEEVPLLNPGVYYSAQRHQPPLPFNPFPELPVATLRKNVFMYDDSLVDYSVLQTTAANVEMEMPIAFTLMDFGSDLHISQVTISAESIQVSVANATADTAYDLYYTPTLNSGFYWRLYFRGATNQTAFILAKPSSPHGFFAVGSANDTDGDGINDGFEKLVTKTDLNDVDSDDDGVWDGPDDFDGDSAKNIDEFMLRTNPFRADSDGVG